MKLNKYITASGPRWQKKWWMRIKKNEVDNQVTGIEVYVPWWGWPFEMLHRIFFKRGS